MFCQSLNEGQFECQIDLFKVAGQVSATTYPRCFVGCVCICLPTHDLGVSAQSSRKLIPSPTSPVFRGASGQLERSGLNRPRHPRKIARQHPPICLPLIGDFSLFGRMTPEEFKSSSPCLLFCVLFCFLQTSHAGLYLFDENETKLHGNHRFQSLTKLFRHDRTIENIQKVRDLLPPLTRQRYAEAPFFGVRFTAVFVTLFTPFCMEHVPTTVRHDVDSKMMAPIVITKPKWFQFWKQPTLVNMQLLARQVDLANDWSRLNERKQKLFEEAKLFQKQTAQFKKQESKWRNLFQTIEWASQPTRKTNKPRVLPGMGLELSLLALHLVVGIAFMMA